MIVLHYIGKVNAQNEPTFIQGVPARDLTDADVEERGLDVKALVKSGLYVAAKPKVTGSISRQTKQEV